MLVLMLRNPKASLGCELQEGQTGEVSDELGAELVKLRIAEEITLKEIVGVAKAPEISKAKKQTAPKGKDFD